MTRLKIKERIGIIGVGIWIMLVALITIIEVSQVANKKTTSVELSAEIARVKT
ncbi:MAG: hypothetical protein HFJ48_02640 [Clostridia bacterium]|nr:hypothetical protein [Clostridia bacterium]